MPLLLQKELPILLIAAGLVHYNLLAVLIRTLKLKPSPLFAKILSGVEEAQMLGKLKNKKEALECALKIAAKKA